MRKLKVPAILGFILLLINTLSYEFALAQNKPIDPVQTSGLSFDLKNGDRVVFLGNSLFENDFQYGYLELALTTRFPDRDVTFRNLGWSGDDVFGNARSTFTNPPTAYEHLIRNIVNAQPTVVFLGYGGIEAQEGEAGLPRFTEGLNKLLDKIDSLGAKTILLSPIPVMSDDSSVNLTKRNADLELYASVIAKTASDRGKQFIDVFKPIQDLSKKTAIIENGVHLNETGYYNLAAIIENSLGLKSRKEAVTINVSKQTAEGSPNTKMLGSGKEMASLKFSVQENYLPLPLPGKSKGMTDSVQIIRITGLKKGLYTLTADNLQILTASARDWEKGVALSQGPSFTQAEQIHEMILQKNELHFFQYRPMNETYIIGFRAYEQGKHMKDLEDQNILIKWLESQIALKRMPKEHIYQLSAVENR